MANPGVSEGPSLTRSNGEVLVGIRYNAEQLSNFAIIDYTKDILTRSTHSGVRMLKWEVNRFFERIDISAFTKEDVRRKIMLQETECPLVRDFWDDQYDPQIRQSRIASQDADLFRALERDETTANGVSTIMSNDYDEILVLEVGYQNLRNVLYMDVVQTIHDFNSCKSVSRDKTRRIWISITDNMNFCESEDLKAKKLEEMDSEEVKRYWHVFDLELLVKPSQEHALPMDGHSYDETCGQTVPQMPPFTRPLPPPPGSEGILRHLPLANINKEQDTMRRPSNPRPDSRPVSPVPPLSQTAQPFSMFTVSLPEQATQPLILETSPDQTIPPRPSFSQTAQPFSAFTVLLPRQTIRPVSFGPLPSSSQAALPPLVTSRPSWPPTSPPGRAFEPVSAENSPTHFSRPHTNRRLWVPSSARKAFALRTRSGDFLVSRGV